MRYRRGPRYNKDCPFPIVADDPLSAEKAVRCCATCATAFNTRLESLMEDFFQIGMLKVLEALPKYDPNHSSGASLITYIKKSVCRRLWKELRKELEHIPYPHEEQHTDDENFSPNPLVSGLNAEACARGTFEEDVVKQLELEKFCEHLPQILAKLSEQERRILEMKFFEGRSGVEIADELSISEGRVSQITKTALEKVKKAYLLALEIGSDNLNTSPQ